MKYVVISAIKTRKDGEPSVVRYPFVFPNNFVHMHVSKVVALLVSFMNPTHEIKVTSAGDLNSMDFQGECSCKSDSIGVSSADGDTQLLRMNDYGSGLLEI